MRFLPTLSAILATGALLLHPAAAQRCGGNEVNCPQRAQVSVLGPGCAPSGMQVPSLRCTARPSPGSTARFLIDSPSSRRAMAMLAIGFSSSYSEALGVALPFDMAPLGFPGCSLYSGGDAAIVGFLLDCRGEHVHRVRVPNRAKYCGTEISVQALILGPHTTAASAELLVSRGLLCTIGSN
jgi:hypothetical protein